LKVAPEAETLRELSETVASANSSGERIESIDVQGLNRVLNYAKEDTRQEAAE
jgi:hypothetical protein